MLQYSRVGNPSQQLDPRQLDAPDEAESVPDQPMGDQLLESGPSPSESMATTSMATVGSLRSPARGMAIPRRNDEQPNTDMSLLQQGTSRTQKPSQHLLSEHEQQGSPAASIPSPGKGPGQAAHILSQPDLQAQSMQSQRSRQAAQRPLSELEQQGSMPVTTTAQQSAQPQPVSQSASLQEVDHVAAVQPVGRRSPTRDLTELEQQGSFTMGSSLSLGEVSAQPEDANQNQGFAAADLALDVARRKAAQAELERQYSALQLQHQQVRLTADALLSR